MNPRWFKYKHDPEIGPLLRHYSDTEEHLEALKRDLRTAGNIEDILEISDEQVCLKYRISRLVRVEEEKVTQRRMSLAWMALIFAAVLVGAANLVVSLILR